VQCTLRRRAAANLTEISAVTQNDEVIGFAAFCSVIHRVGRQCFKNGSTSEARLCTRRLSLRTPYLQFFGDKSFLWSPTVHSAAIKTSGKRNSIGQPIDLRKIDIDARRNQSFRIWTFEHQLRQRNLQILSEEPKALRALLSSAECLWEMKTLIECASSSFERFAD
jgi:hypothetical protein